MTFAPDYLSLAPAKGRQVRRTVAFVGIQDHWNSSASAMTMISPLACVIPSRSAAPVTLAFFTHDTSTQSACNCDRPVGGAVVGNDDFINETHPGKTVQRLLDADTEGLLLVKARDDRRYFDCVCGRIDGKLSVQGVQ
jgi:hypothetical protein